jgi:hypothetical protein
MHTLIISQQKGPRKERQQDNTTFAVTETEMRARMMVRERSELHGRNKTLQHNTCLHGMFEGEGWQEG